MYNKQVRLKEGVDTSLIWLYTLLVGIGLVSIFMVQYRENDDIMQIILKGSKDYGKQIRWLIICTVLAIFILLTDSKLYTATANLLFAMGVFLILLTFVFHSDVKGSRSFLGYGKLKLFQPAEFTKVFALLALSKYLSQVDTFIEKQKHQLIAAAFVLVPSILTILQNETGVALVYFALFLPMYREGLPGIYLIYVAAIGILTVLAFLLKPIWVVVFIALLSIVILFSVRNNRRRIKVLRPTIILFAIIGIAYTYFALPAIYNNVLPNHHKQRVLDLFGIEKPSFNATSADYSDASDKKKKSKGDSYNVKQSKIAIGSGGFLGKGFLNNTQTRFDFVPEQHTDFIFCSVAETFGFVGSITLLIIYFALLWRIIKVAERQRSKFSRVFAYGVASIIFFHIFINMAMTLGLAPVIGIPLPFLSYGGTSLITFTVLLFILIKLDADRQMALR
jgi:rod shape determining protein RodA